MAAPVVTTLVQMGGRHLPMLAAKESCHYCTQLKGVSIWMSLEFVINCLNFFAHPPKLCALCSLFGRSFSSNQL